MEDQEKSRSTVSRPSAEETHPTIFTEVDALIELLHQWIDLAEIPDDRTALGIVKISFLVRAFNQYRAIVNLLRTNHWEDALILTRSLFELLLNLEELLRESINAERVASRFLRFSMLQRYLSWRENKLYEIEMGRAPSDTGDEIKGRDSVARKAFREFLHTDKKGREKWRRSWCNKDVSTLCSASKDPMRKHQYRLLYSWGSEFAHSSPAAVFAAMQLREEPADVAKFAEHVGIMEENRLREVAALASAFLIGLVLRVGDRLPDYDIRSLADVMRTMGKGILDLEIERAVHWPSS